MPVQISNIVKGVLHKLRHRKQKGTFHPLSWTQEKILKHQDDQKVKEIGIGDLRLRYKRPYEVLHTYKELFEDEIYRFAAGSSSPLIVDCGANIGLSVLYFKRLFPGSTVVAFEPDVDNFALLQENIRLNGLLNVDCRQSAVWTENGTITFSSDGTQGSQISLEPDVKNAVSVKAERLADLLRNGKVDFLKVDIEGAELDVMQDCAPYLGNVGNLFVEYHGKAGETEKLTALLGIMKAHFNVYIKLAADGLSHPFVQKSTGASFDVQLNIFGYKN